MRVGLVLGVEAWSLQYFGGWQWGQLWMLRVVEVKWVKVLGVEVGLILRRGENEEYGSGRGKNRIKINFK